MQGVQTLSQSRFPLNDLESIVDHVFDQGQDVCPAFQALCFS